MNRHDTYHIKEEAHGPWWWPQRAYYLVCKRFGKLGPFYERAELHNEARRLGLKWIGGL